MNWLREAAEAIANQWSRIERDASETAQFEQSCEAGHDRMTSEILDILNRHHGKSLSDDKY